MTLLAFIVIYCVEYLPEDGQKKAETRRKITACLYITVSNYSAVVGTYTVTWKNVNNSYIYINFVLPVHRMHTAY